MLRRAVAAVVDMFFSVEGATERPRELLYEDTFSRKKTRRTGIEAPMMATAVSTAVQMVTSLPL